jgi:hypothetical protein
MSFAGFAYTQQPGCTDPYAPNFDPDATENDGSCTYGTTNYLPLRLSTLPGVITETSGLMFWNGLLWTHNDSGGSPDLFALDPDDTEIVLRKVRIKNASNADWEDITRDEAFAYIGDFGNNNGTRTNLRIYKVSLDELEGDTATAEAIYFSYPDQTDFSSRPQNHNFDAEAMVSLGDSLYIFSKNWANQRTKVYVLPKTPGTFTAHLKTEMFAGGLITSADFNEQDSVIMLTAYTKLLQPYIWLLWDFRESEVLSGNRRRINLNLPLHQVEGVAWKGGHEYWISNEALGNLEAALHSINTTAWIAPVISGAVSAKTAMPLMIYPNPVRDEALIKWNRQEVDARRIELISMDGKAVFSEILSQGADSVRVDMRTFPAGIYSAILYTADGQFSERVVYTPYGR